MELLWKRSKLLKYWFFEKYLTAGGGQVPPKPGCLVQKILGVFQVNFIYMYFMGGVFQINFICMYFYVFQVWRKTEERQNTFHMKCCFTQFCLQCSLRGWPGMCCWFSIDPAKALPRKQTEKLYIEFKWEILFQQKLFHRNRRKSLTLNWNENFDPNLNCSYFWNTSQSCHNVSKVDRPTVCNVDSC